MDIHYIECTWTNDEPDACPFCAGNKCNKCGAGMCGYQANPCEHDSFERHEEHGQILSASDEQEEKHACRS